MTEEDNKTFASNVGAVQFPGPVDGVFAVDLHVHLHPIPVAIVIGPEEDGHLRKLLEVCQDWRETESIRGTCMSYHGSPYTDILRFIFVFSKSTLIKY